MPRLPTEEQLDNLLNAVRAELAELEHGVPYTVRGRKKGRFTIFDLLDRAADDEPGYPASSLGGTSPTTVIDSDEDPHRGGAPGDRVGELAVFGEHGHPAEAFAEIRVLLERARAGLIEAVDKLKDAVPPAPPRDPDGCVSCARIPKYFSPLWEGHESTDRCQFCASARAEQIEVDGQVVKKAGEDVPLEVLEVHRQGKYITTKVWREVLATQRQLAQKPKGKKARKRSYRSLVGR